MVEQEPLLRALWSLVPDDASPEDEIRVSPEQLASALDISREEAGQLLSDLGAGWRKTRAGGQRQRWRTIRVEALGPRTPAVTAPAPLSVLTPAAPKHAVHVDVACQRCGTGLPEYLQYIGLCGDCLQDAQQEIRSVPGPRYGCVAEAQQPHAEPEWYGAVRQVSYGGR